MKLNDAVWGALLLLFAAAVLVHVQSFPPMPGQKYGPAVFPGLIATGLAVCGLLLIGNGLRSLRADGGSRWVELQPWVRMPRRVLALVAVIAVNVAYILLVQDVGFLIVATLYLVVLFAIFGVRASRIVPLAVVLTLLVHFMFYKLLKVPLPWGLLQSFAW